MTEKNKYHLLERDLFNFISNCNLISLRMSLEEEPNSELINSIEILYQKCIIEYKKRWP